MVDDNYNMKQITLECIEFETIMKKFRNDAGIVLDNEEKSNSNNNRYQNNLINYYEYEINNNDNNYVNLPDLEMITDNNNNNNNNDNNNYVNLPDLEMITNNNNNNQYPDIIITKKTGDNIKDALEQITKNYGFNIKDYKNESIYVTTDCGSNMLRAIDLSKFKGLKCFDHRINTYDYRYNK